MSNGRAFFASIQKQTQRDRDGYLQDIGVVRIDKPTEKDFADLGKGYEGDRPGQIDVSGREPAQDAARRWIQGAAEGPEIGGGRAVLRHWLVVPHPGVRSWRCSSWSSATSSSSGR